MTVPLCPPSENFCPPVAYDYRLTVGSDLEARFLPSGENITVRIVKNLFERTRTRFLLAIFQIRILSLEPDASTDLLGENATA